MFVQTADAGRYAYSTLITRASYTAGVIILAHTLRRHRSRFPLIVFYTQNLKGTPALRALQLQATSLDLILHECEPLVPPGHVQVQLIAERFRDTWTKLRLFGDDVVWQFDGVCYLDADMAIFNGNMDDIFSVMPRLPHGHIAASHACVCNVDRDPWAPADWTIDNCAYTPQSHPTALDTGTPVQPESRPTHHLLNSGMFVYRPTPHMWKEMLHYFNTSDKLATYKFPDQDFLTDFFRNKWQSIGWQWNALKTMRYLHTNIWRDDSVRCLHYIVDKPWASRLSADGIAGFRGRDGETHRWWWIVFGEWAARCCKSNETEVLSIMDKLIAPEDGTADDEDMRAIGSNVQGLANNKAHTVGK